MIPGKFEREYQHQLGNNPNRLTIAEVNPRFTNLSDALLAVVRIQGKGQTISEMRAVLESGILTVDRYPIPNNISIEKARDLVYELDQKLKPKGSRIVLRMPTKPNAGFIFVGDVQNVKHELDKLLRN